MISNRKLDLIKLLLISFILLGVFPAAAQLIKAGTWRGVISYGTEEVPFTFELSYPNGEIPQIVIKNGGNRQIVKNASIEGDTLMLPLDPFDVEIRTAFSAMEMKGVYRKYYRDVTRSFTAAYGQPRMRRSSISEPPMIEEKWALTFSPGETGESKGICLVQQDGANVTGTIMTEVGDYRFFEGILDGDSIRMSCFDGVHAFLFHGKKSDTGWQGQMIYDKGYSESWTAEYKVEAELRDPFDIVKIEPGKQKPYYDLLGAGEGPDAINPEKYQGKVLVIQVFGTWCPNSYDQTRYLVDWYNENSDRKVEILASSYEANYSKEYGLQRIEEYRVANEIPYDIVLGGKLSKRGAAMAFEFIDQLEAFPTLIIMDKQGYARHVLSYFNGPATGAYFQEFDEKFNKIIDALEAE